MSKINQKKNNMVKHLHIATFMFSLISLIFSLMLNKDLFTVFGWFTSVCASLTVIIYYKIIEMDDK